MKRFGSMAVFAAIAACALVAMAAATGCQSGPPKISIVFAKAELSHAIKGEAMVTMNIRNDGGTDVIQGVKTDIAGANASVHDREGKRMVAMDLVEVAGKSTLKLNMDGSHIMIRDMPKNMKEGSKFNLTMVFKKSGEMSIPLTFAPH